MIRRNHGHIVTIASMAGHVGASHFVDYAASKHATIGLIDSLKIELFREAPKIRTTTVCPFFINTGMFDGAELPKYVFVLIYIFFKVSDKLPAISRIHKVSSFSLSKLRNPSCVILVSLLLTLDIFHALFECFYC